MKKRNRRLVHVVGFLLVISLVFTLFSSNVLAIPPLPTEFYGRIINESTSNITLEVRDSSGTICGSFLAENNSFYGLLSCRGDDLETPEDEGASPGEAITFYINGSVAATFGVTNFSSGDFYEVNITRAEPPVFGNCSNATIEEDGNGSDVQIDLYQCTTDADTNLSELDFSIINQSNSALIDCFVSTNRYVTCNNPGADLNGNSTLTLYVEDDYGLSDTTNATIFVTPVPDAPRFLQNWTTQYANESTSFLFTANCSDPDGDTVLLSTNTTLFPINNLTGIINTSLIQEHVGNNSVNVSCTDGNFTSHQLLNITVFDVNNPPILNTIPSLIAIVGELFEYDIDATDSDGDTLTFSDNTSLFVIGSSTGLISFTPTLDQIGDYTFLVVVSDGQENDSQTVSLRIIRGPFCGDGLCSNNENCQVCSSDCGICPPGAGGGSGGSGGEAGSGGSGGSGGGGGGGGASVTGQLCVEKWECSTWNECSVDGEQQRECLEVNRCGTRFSRPDEVQECSPPSCYDNVLNQEEEGVDCGGPCSPCIAPATCFDNIQNQGEEGVDCGGPCTSCFVKNLQIFPVLEQPLDFGGLFRSYPWLLFLLALLIVVIAILLDRWHTKRLQQLEFEDYHDAILDYRKRRRKHLLFAFNLAAILIVSSLYLFYYSFDSKLLVLRLWILGIIFTLVPFFVNYVLRQYELLDRSIELRLQRSRQLAHYEDYTIVNLEQEALMKLEALLANQILTGAKSGTVVSVPEFYSFVRELYTHLAANLKERKLFLSHILNKDKIDLIETVLRTPRISNYAKTYQDIDLLVHRIRHAKQMLEHEQEPVTDELDAATLVSDMSKDIHFKSVVASDPAFSTLITNAQKLSNFFTEQFSKRKEHLKILRKREMDYIKTFQKSNDKIRGIIEGKNEFIKIYNMLVQLFNRYNKNLDVAGSDVPLD